MLWSYGSIENKLTLQPAAAEIQERTGKVIGLGVAPKKKKNTKEECASRTWLMFSVSNIIFATTFCNRACVGFLAFIRNYESPLYAHITLVSNTLVSNTRLRKQASVRVACDDWIIIFFVGVCFWWTFAWRQMSWRGVTNLMISIIVCVHRFPFSIQSLGCTQRDRCDPKIFVVCQRYYAAKSASDVSDPSTRLSEEEPKKDNLPWYCFCFPSCFWG